MTLAEIQKLLETNIPDCQAIINGDGHHYEAIVISDIFADKTLIQQQKIVYQVLNPYIKDGTIHAISIKTYTIKKWETQHG